VVEGDRPQQARGHPEPQAPGGQELLRELAADADVIVENFRPGVMEKWGLGPDTLLDVNPRLVMLRVTGFGQDGPYKERRAFGTLMEAMSGFAHQTGQEDGPPTLPPFGLADGVAGHRGRLRRADRALPPRPARRRGPGDRPRAAGAAAGHPRARPDGLRPARDHRGPARQPVAEQRPRNAYVTRDGRWVAISPAPPRSPSG
jgi:crotonobetainyl-CoA:carnitine CoA-transferase CaiB-like acyl-CoA transferase